MQTGEQPRRSVWMYGFESEEPTEDRRREHAREISARLGVDIQPPPMPRLDDIQLRPPRLTPPGTIAGFCFQDAYERALHSHGGYRELALLRRFPNPPDVVAHPRSEDELEAVLAWCSDGGYAAIPYGGGSSVVDGVTPPRGIRRHRLHRHGPVRPGPRGGPGLQSGPHPGGGVRPRPGRPAPPPRTDPAPLSPELHQLHPGRLDSNPLGGGTTPPRTPTSTTSWSRCECSLPRAGGSRGACRAAVQAPAPTAWRWAARESWAS